MGMAASQARFLGLTARMNNVEFEGQQINQQRTALSNKSASYYTDLLGMEVPTAPSVEEFTQTVYTFNDGALTNQITSLIADSTPGQEGKYKVSYIRSWTDDFSVVSASPSIITEVTPNTTYKIGATTLRSLGVAPAGDDPYYDSLSTDQQAKLLEEEKTFLNLLQETHGNKDDYLVRYVQNTSTGEYDTFKILLPANMKPFSTINLTSPALSTAILTTTRNLTSLLTKLAPLTELKKLKALLDVN